jgi:hypothetical protein
MVLCTATTSDYDRVVSAVVNLEPHLMQHSAHSAQKNCAATTRARGGGPFSVPPDREYNRRRRSPQTKVINQLVVHVTGHTRAKYQLRSL